MKILKLAAAILCFILIAGSTIAQPDSCRLKISLLTVGPGEDLYSIFGHSALRVQNKNNGEDIIFNYGTFDFDDPDFYVKFIRGKLLYFVSVERMEDFMYQYHYEKRSVTEQVLQLDCREQEQLYAALSNNAREENKYYLYEFLSDNCSTRIRDIVIANSQDSLRFKRIIPEPAPTFREMLFDYLDSAGHHWSRFGIDIVLGSRIDVPVENREAMFLPDYLFKGFDSAYHNKPLVAARQTIYQAPPRTRSSGFSFTPLMATLLLLITGGILLFVGSPKVSRAFDQLLFFVLGITGVLITFMWTGTEHQLCRDNYNLLWALPTHIFFAFILHRHGPLVRTYAALTAALCLVVLAGWFYLPQGMNSAFFPLVLLSGIRSAALVLKKRA